MSLLVKWKWRLLFHDTEGWKEVLVAKYGRPITCKVFAPRGGSKSVVGTVEVHGTCLTKRIGGSGKRMSFYGQIHILVNC